MTPAGRQAKDLAAVEVDGGRGEYGDQLDRPGEHGELWVLHRPGRDPDARETRNERFEFGLDCVLEGIAAKLAKGPARA